MIKGWKSAHGDISKARAATAMAAKPFVVRSVNKNGAVSKMAPHPQLDYCATRDAADARAAALESMNPGSKFVVCEN